MATLPIHLEVEDVAVGPVLIALRRMPGIIKMNLDIGGPTAAPLPNGQKPNLQGAVTAVLLKANGGVLSLKEIIEQTGMIKTSLYGALNQLKQRGVVVREGSGLWKLSKKAAHEMGAVEMLPSPDASGAVNGHDIKRGPKGRAVPGSGWKLLREALDGGALKRIDITKQIEAHGVSAKSVSGVMERAKRDKLIGPTKDGLWMLTAKGRGQQAAVEQ